MLDHEFLSGVGRETIIGFVQCGEAFCERLGGIECFRIARNNIPSTPHILAFGVEKMAENGQKQKVFASEKPVFSFFGSLARRHFRVMFEGVGKIV